MPTWTNIVCRAAYHGIHGHYREDETFQFGQGRARRAHLQQDPELKKSRQGVAARRLGEHARATTPEQDVWRFEAQLRRERCCKSFGCPTAERCVSTRLPALLGSMLSTGAACASRRARTEPLAGSTRAGSSSPRRRSPAEPLAARRTSSDAWPTTDATVRQVRGLRCLRAGADSAESTSFEARLRAASGDRSRSYLEARGPDFDAAGAATRRAERTG